MNFIDLNIKNIFIVISASFLFSNNFNCYSAEIPLEPSWYEEFESVYEKVIETLFKIKPNTLNDLIDQVHRLWRESKLMAFDAVVGDTSCHARALLLAYFNNLAQNNQRELDTKQSLLLLALYLLKACKVTQRNHAGFILDERTNRDNLVSFLGISRNQARNLFVPLQRLASYLTVTLTQQLAHSLPETAEHQAIAALLEQTNYDAPQAERRLVMPTYGIIRALIAYAHAHNIPIVMRIQLGADAPVVSHGSLVVVYRSQNTIHGPRFAPVTVNNLESQLLQAAVVIESYSALLEGEYTQTGTQALSNYLTSLDLEEALLANEAEHPQYAGPYKDTQPDWAVLELQEFHEFNRLRLVAQTSGYCRANRNMLYTDHIYAAQLSKVLMYNPHIQENQENRTPERIVISDGTALFYPNNNKNN